MDFLLCHPCTPHDLATLRANPISCATNHHGHSFQLTVLTEIRPIRLLLMARFGAARGKMVD
ncbi:hypothetical protein [Lysinibacillus yapensis]|uniref:hypothetical protein n=1 Tax=Ureibacillus yapensis TaxID=2304605 RepID=UPI001314021C|nr:hypothetical protein [Lysinibacillus yapensis]